MINESETSAELLREIEEAVQEARARAKVINPSQPEEEDAEDTVPTLPEHNDPMMSPLLSLYLLLTPSYRWEASQLEARALNAIEAH